MMTELESLRDALAVVDGIQSCQIGLEANISADDYPLVRISPLRAVPGRGYHGRTVECMAYFGPKTAPSEGMSAVYTDLLDIEAKILTVLRAQSCRYLETVVEPAAFQPIPEQAYKIAGIRFELPTTNAAPA